MQTIDVLAGLAILAGVVGVLVPLLPGSALIAVAMVVWALVVGEPAGWVAAGVALTALALATAGKYVLGGRHLQRQGVPNRTLLAGGVLAIVGFFVVPIVGLIVGFVLGIYLAEWQRVGRSSAWASTRSALTAVGLAILVELTGAMIAASAFVAGVVAT